MTSSTTGNSKEKDLAVQLRALAADPENRPYIVKQGCLPGLAMFLNSSDNDIVIIALEALEFVSLYKGHRAAMAAEEGLASSLRKLMLSPNTKVKRLAMTVYSNVQDNIEPPAQQQQQPAVITTSAPAPASAPEAPQPDSNAQAAKLSAARTYHVYIKDLENQQKGQIENCLLQVKGVLSFLIDLYARKAVVRSLTGPESLTGALRSAGFAVLKVDEHGDPSKSYKTPSDESNKENAQSSNGGGAGAGGGSGGGWFGWLVPAGGAEPAKKRARKDENSGMFGRVGKILWG